MLQAGVLAISEVAKNLLLEKMHNQSIVLLVDSQATIKAPIKYTVTSITVFNCIRNLHQFGKQNHVSIAWIPGHAGEHGHEVADYVAKSGSKSKIHGPKPCITVPYAGPQRENFPGGTKVDIGPPNLIWPPKPYRGPCRKIIFRPGTKLAQIFFPIFCPKLV